MAEKLTTAWSGHHPAKDQLRAAVWAQLKAASAALGEPVGHIPGFVGAEQAAARLAALPVWQQARVIKSNPDTAQEPVRRRALQDGKVVYMAVPRLTHERCFVALSAADLRQRDVPPEVAATHRGAMRYGRFVALAEMSPIDLVMVGCVAVSRDGGRTGKGAGFADLELGILRQLGLVQAGTPIVTTVHPLQIVASAQLPMLTHDWSLTWIVTPAEAIATGSQRTQPMGLQWEHLRPEQLATIPVLRTLRLDHEKGSARGQPGYTSSPKKYSW